MPEVSFNRRANLLALYRRPGMTRQELIDAYRNANRENDYDFSDELADILDEKYPDWNTSFWSAPNRVQDGKNTIIVTSCSQSKSFPSAKQAYIWLVEQIFNTKPDLDIDNYVLNEMFSRGTHGAWYLAASPAELFPGNSRRANNPSCYHKLSNGWFLNTALSIKQIRDKLMSLTAVCDAYHLAWSWMSNDKSYGSQDILDSLDEMLKIFDI